MGLLILVYNAAIFQNDSLCWTNRFLIFFFSFFKNKRLTDLRLLLLLPNRPSPRRRLLLLLPRRPKSDNVQIGCIEKAVAASFNAIITLTWSPDSLHHGLLYYQFLLADGHLWSWIQPNFFACPHLLIVVLFLSFLYFSSLARGHFWLDRFRTLWLRLIDEFPPLLFLVGPFMKVSIKCITAPPF